MIYITGDTHGEKERLMNRPWTEKDTLIVCGDFGFLFYDTAQEQMFLDQCERDLPYTICFVDGNHENFDMLERYPVEQWNGGFVHRIRRNILHLMRGQMYTIEQKTFFVFGGAYSIDRYMRLKNISYWEQELPTNEEYKWAVENLKAHDMRADYILTHTAPSEMIRRLGYVPDPHEMELSGYLEYILYEVEHRHWYCGHWHEDRAVTDRFTVLWFDTVCLG